MGTPAQRLQSERLRFPGLLPREIIILRNWLKLQESKYDRFDYNVRVGQGMDPGPSFSDEVRQDAILNTQKRIDAVGYRGLHVTLIEVKDRAGFSAVGQLVGYRELWQQEHRDGPPPQLLLISNRVQPDLLPVLKASGIALDLVEADFSELRSRT